MSASAGVAGGVTAPVTPDGRYLVVRGRLWRRADPGLRDNVRRTLVAELMAARRAVRTALAAGNPKTLAATRARVDAAKVALGERGPVWWTDGAPDLNRRLAKNTPYADWYAAVEARVSDRRIHSVELQT